jgi:hypothetical protein
MERLPIPGESDQWLETNRRPPPWKIARLLRQPASAHCDFQALTDWPEIGENMAKDVLIPAERIEKVILLIRGHKVMVDTDLANLYGVSTKRLNEQVRRNLARFPADFMFQLTAQEAGA